MSPEELCHLQDIEPVVVIRLDLYQRHPAAHSILLVQALHRTDYRHLLELLDHLLDEVLITVHDDCDAREIRCFRDAHRQAVDVELASGKHAHNPHEDTSLILDEYRQDVFHGPISS